MAVTTKTSPSAQVLKTPRTGNNSISAAVASEIEKKKIIRLYRGLTRSILRFLEAESTIAATFSMKTLRANLMKKDEKFGTAPEEVILKAIDYINKNTEYHDNYEITIDFEKKGQFLFENSALLNDLFWKHTKSL